MNLDFLDAIEACNSNAETFVQQHKNEIVCYEEEELIRVRED